MAVGKVTKYNQFESILFGTSYRQWDDATTGSVMWLLAKETYTPSLTHTTVANIGTAGVDYITIGSDGEPMAIAGRTIDATTTPGTTYFKSSDANFGAAVSIVAKYLIAIHPVSANVFASTAKLLFYIDLDTSTTSSVVQSSSSAFVVNQPDYWWKTT